MINEKIIISILTIVLLGMQSCTHKNSENPIWENNFILEFQGEMIKIKSDKISLSSVFQPPDLLTDTNIKENWSFINTIKSSMVFAGEKGTLRRDIFTSQNGQLERRTWISDQKHLVAFQHIYTNSSNEDVKLYALYPFLLSGQQNLFNKNSNYRILTQKTDKNGRPEAVIPMAGKVIQSDPFFIINDSLDNNNLFIGSQSYYLHLFELKLEFVDKGDEHHIKSLESKCNFEGVIVPPEANRESQWIVLAQDKDPYKLITDYTVRTNKLHALKKPEDTPPSVYCAFYYHGLGYNEVYFKSDIATFKRDYLPFDVFQVDACWQQHYGHDFEFNERTFPSGMKWVADQIHSLGYKPGIWTAPYIVRINWSNPATDLVKNHPEWLLKNSKGEYCTWLSYYILDTTYPGVTDYLEASYRKLAQDWGYEYFKFDFMRAIFSDADAQFYDKNATSLEAYRKGLEAIRRGVGEESYISVCGGHYGASYGIANSQRSGSDTKSIWDQNELPKYRQNILRTWMSEFWHVDPDAMMIRRQENELPTGKKLTLGLFTDDEANTNTLNQLIGGGMVCFAEDFAIIDEDRKALYRHVIPSINSPSQPLDIFDPICPNLMLTHVSPVCKNLPDWTMISVVNWSNNSKSYEIKLDDHVLNASWEDRFVISEFFSQRVLGVFERNQSIIIKNQKPHQSQLFRIIPWDSNEPVLAGTNLHFSGGGVEITNWESKNGIVKGTIDTPWHYPISITIVFPDSSDTGFKIETINIAAGQKNFIWKSSQPR